MDKMSDEEIEGFARRMGETGATELELADPERWRDFVNYKFRGREMVGATPAQIDLAWRGRFAYEAGLVEAGLRIAIPAPLRRYRAGVRGWEIQPFIYRDAKTGRFVSAWDAYSRREFLGLSTPRPVLGVWKYPSWWIPG